MTLPTINKVSEENGFQVTEWCIKFHNTDRFVFNYFQNRGEDVWAIWERFTALGAAEKQAIVDELLSGYDRYVVNEDGTIELFWAEKKPLPAPKKVGVTSSSKAVKQKAARIDGSKVSSIISVTEFEDGSAVVNCRSGVCLTRTIPADYWQEKLVWAA